MEKEIAVPAVKHLHFKRKDDIPTSTLPVKKKNHTQKGTWGRQHQRRNAHKRDDVLLESKVIENALLYKTRRSTIIHPDGSFRISWDILICLLVVQSVVYVPLSLSFDIENSVTRAFQLMFDCLFLVDIVLNFNTGYLDEIQHVQQLVVDKRQIASRYIRSWFFLDIASSLPIDNIFEAVGNTDDSLSSLKLIRVVRIFRLLKLMKLVKFARLLDNTTWLNRGVLGLVKLLIKVAFMAHGLACAWFSVGSLSDKASWLDLAAIRNSNPSSQYLASFYWTIATMTGVGYGDVYATTSAERMFAILTMLIGASLFGFIIGNINAFLENIDQHRALHRQKTNEVKEYSHACKLPRTLDRRVKLYYEYYLSKKSMFDEAGIMADLSTNLRVDCLMDIYKPTVDQLESFMSLVGDRAYIATLLMYLKPQLSVHGEKIARQGTIGKEMFFVMKGEVEVVHTDKFHVDYVVAVHTTGAYFGDVALFTQISRYGTFYANSKPVELYLLAKEDLIASFADFPDMEDVLVRNAFDRYWMMNAAYESFVQSEDVRYSVASSYAGIVDDDVSYSSSVSRRSRRRTPNRRPRSTLNIIPDQDPGDSDAEDSGSDAGARRPASGTSARPQAQPEPWTLSRIMNRGRRGGEEGGGGEDGSTRRFRFLPLLSSIPSSRRGSHSNSGRGSLLFRLPLTGRFTRRWSSGVEPQPRGGSSRNLGVMEGGGGAGGGAGGGGGPEPIPEGNSCIEDESQIVTAPLASNSIPHRGGGGGSDSAAASAASPVAPGGGGGGGETGQAEGGAGRGEELAVPAVDAADSATTEVEVDDGGANLNADDAEETADMNAATAAATSENAMDGSGGVVNAAAAAAAAATSEDATDGSGGVVNAAAAAAAAAAAENATDGSGGVVNVDTATEAFVRQHEQEEEEDDGGGDGDGKEGEHTDGHGPLKRLVIVPPHPTHMEVEDVSAASRPSFTKVSRRRSRKKGIDGEADAFTHNLFSSKTAERERQRVSLTSDTAAHLRRKTLSRQRSMRRVNSTRRSGVSSRRRTIEQEKREGPLEDPSLIFPRLTQSQVQSQLRMRMLEGGGQVLELNSAPPDPVAQTLGQEQGRIQAQVQALDGASSAPMGHQFLRHPSRRAVRCSLVSQVQLVDDNSEVEGEQDQNGGADEDEGGGDGDGDKDGGGGGKGGGEVGGGGGWRGGVRSGEIPSPSPSLFGGKSSSRNQENGVGDNTSELGLGADPVSNSSNSSFLMGEDSEYEEEDGASGGSNFNLDIPAIPSVYFNDTLVSVEDLRTRLSSLSTTMQDCLRTRRSSVCPVNYGDQVRRTSIVGGLLSFSEPPPQNYEDVEESEADLLRRFIVAPSLGVKVKWDILVSALIVYSVIMVPFRIGFTHDATGAMWVFEILVDVCFGLDLLVSFRTAYWDDDVLVTVPSLIKRKYLKGWFLVDFVSTVPLDYMLTVIMGDGNSMVSSLKLFRVLRLSRLLKMARLLKLGKFADTIEETLYVTPSVVRLVKLLFRVSYVAHLLACFWFMVGTGQHNGSNTSETSRSWIEYIDVDQSPVEEQYLTAIYWAFTTMTTVGYGDVIPMSDEERLYAIAGMMLGATTFGYIVGSLSLLVGQIHSAEARTARRMGEIKDYVREQHVSKARCTQILTYFDSYFAHRASFDKKSILKALPSSLRGEIILHNHRPTIKKIGFFRGHDREFIAQILEILSPQFCQSLDYVFREGETGREMFFLVEGSVEIVGNAGVKDKERVYKVLREGCAFGEIALLMSVKRTASIRAYRNCTMYALSRSDLTRMTIQYPMLANQMRLTVKEMLQGLENDTFKMSAESKNDIQRRREDVQEAEETAAAAEVAAVGGATTASESGGGAGGDNFRPGSTASSSHRITSNSSFSTIRSPVVKSSRLRLTGSSTGGGSTKPTPSSDAPHSGILLRGTSSSASRHQPDWIASAMLEKFTSSQSSFGIGDQAMSSRMVLESSVLHASEGDSEEPGDAGEEDSSGKSVNTTIVPGVLY